MVVYGVQVVSTSKNIANIENNIGCICCVDILERPDGSAVAIDGHFDVAILKVA